MSKKQKTDVLALTRKLMEKKAEQLEAENPTYKTSCLFRPRVYSDVGEFNIKTASKPRLLDGFKTLYNHAEAAKTLGVDINHDGYSVDEWTADFITRRKVLDRVENIKFIEVTEAELRKYLTPAQLKELGIEGVMDDVNKILKDIK